MTMYHRGKARSPYRKRSVPINLFHGAAGIVHQFILLPNATGLIETKSWRGHITIEGLDSMTNNGSGWVGFYRGQFTGTQLSQLTAGQSLAMSEVFGVQAWTRGRNDHIIPMELIGVTLSATESLAVISGCHLLTTRTSGRSDVLVVGTRTSAGCPSKRLPPANWRRCPIDRQLDVCREGDPGMMPWTAFGTPTPAMLAWASQQGPVRTNVLPYSKRVDGITAEGAPHRGKDPYVLQQTRYGNLGRNINRAYYANLSRQRRKARGG